MYASLPERRKNAQSAFRCQAAEMLRSLILSFAFAFNFIGMPVLGKLAFVYGDVKLTASENCTGDTELTTADNTVTVARRGFNGMWIPVDRRYIGRIAQDSPSSVNITNLNYKDSGLFEFFCGKKLLNAVQLLVLPLDITTVTEGDTAELSCYSSTSQVSWSKEEGEIRDLEVISKEDEASPGRFLLILMKVQQEDQGIYICCRESCDAPKASKLMVNPRKPNQTTSPPPHQCHTTQSPNEGNGKELSEMISWVLLALFGAAAIVLAIFLYLEKKKGRKPKKSPKRDNNEEHIDMDGLLGQTKRNGSHANSH